MDIIEYIKSLGWSFTEHWSNRAIYELNEGLVFALFEHQGNIGIVSDGNFQYYNLKEDDISRFTEILKERMKMLQNPKDYTIYQLNNNNNKLMSLFDEFALRKLEEEEE